MCARSAADDADKAGASVRVFLIGIPAAGGVSW
jgi:hypothetical protein